MTPGPVRRRLAWAGRLLAAAVIIAAVSGRLPHLVVTQAVVSSLLTMVAAPLCLLDRPPRARAPRWSVPAFPAVALMSLGTVAAQLPPVVASIGEGGPLTALALGAMLLMALGFWSVVMPPARLSGIHAAGYVVAGSLPISMPAMFLIMLPRDIYTVFHAAAPGPLVPLDDQTFAGFVLFVFVKVTLFVAFSCLFLSAFAGSAEDGRDGDGDRARRQPPALPGWVIQLLKGGPTSREPVPAGEEGAVARQTVGSGRR